MTAVGIYTRLSQDREGQTSTSRQEADCRKLAEGRGWTVHRVYGDLDLSGYSGVSRPAFEELLEDLAAGTIVGVVSWKLDRLSRNRRDWNRLAELVDGGVKLACVQDPVDTTTTLGSVVVDLLASMARAESANTSTRVRSANLERAEAGKPHPSGQRAFGYTREWTIVRSEAAVLRKAADRLLSGDSLHAVCRDLNDRGVTTTGGNRWRGFTLSRTLRSPHVAGLRTHHGQVHPGTWTPILDRATWERLRAVLDRRGASHRGGGRLKHLLSGGVLVCGECGSTMTSRPREDKRLRYVCRQETGGCGHVGILGEETEELVRDVVLEALAGPGLAKALEARGDDRTAELVGQLTEAEARLEQLAADYYGSGHLSRAEYTAAKKRADETIDTIRGQLPRRRASWPVSTATSPRGGTTMTPPPISDARCSWRCSSTSRSVPHSWAATGSTLTASRSGGAPRRTPRDARTCARRRLRRATSFGGHAAWPSSRGMRVAAPSRSSRTA